MDQISLHADSVAQGPDPLGAATIYANDVSLPAGLPSGLVARPPTGSGGEIQSGARPRASTPSPLPWPTLPTPLAGRGTTVTMDKEVTLGPQQYPETTKSSLDHVTGELRRETTKLTIVTSTFCLQIFHQTAALSTRHRHGHSAANVLKVWLEFCDGFVRNLIISPVVKKS